MRTLYELAISTVIKTGVNITELPEAIQEHINNYRDHPIPLQFPDHYDPKTTIDFAKTINHPLNDDELWQINHPEYIKGYLTQFQNEKSLRQQWMALLGTMLNSTKNFNNKEKVKIYKKMFHFLYTNCGVFNGAISDKATADFIHILLCKHGELVALHDWKYFDNDDRQMYTELWGMNAFIQCKMKNWREIHDELGQKILTINHAFPSFELDNIWLQRTKYPYNITQSIYWRDILKRVRLDEAIEHWEFRVREGYSIWLYRGIEIFRQILHEDGYIAEIDWTFFPPNDIWNSDYTNVFADVMAENGAHKPWFYSYRDDRFGYYRHQWYYERQLVYEEGYDDYYGYYSHDHTTDIIRVEDMRNECFLENVIVVEQPRLFLD